MVYKCVVLVRKYNYKTDPNVATFGFPNGKELKMKWIAASIVRMMCQSNNLMFVFAADLCVLIFYSFLLTKRESETITITE